MGLSKEQVELVLDALIAERNNWDNRAIESVEKSESEYCRGFADGVDFALTVISDMLENK